MHKIKMVASGRVQSVGFRWSVQFLASELGDIYGRVWNNEDGTVTILAQSEQSEKLSHLDVQLSNFPDYFDFKVQ